MEVYVKYWDERWNEGGYDPEDSWSRDSYGGDYWTTGVTLTPGAHDSYETNEEIAVGDTVYVVSVTYGDGDTFGSDGGYGQIVYVGKDKELAEKIEKWCGSASYGDKAPHNNDFYPYWLGYFNWVQHVDLKEFVVEH